MFNCAFCGKTAPPRVKPIKVVIPTDIRDVSYSNKVLDPETEETYTKLSTGTEFMAEYDQCAECAGLPPVVTPQANHRPIVNIIHGMQTHARNCKKRLDECQACKSNLEGLKNFPLTSLSKGLEDSNPDGIVSNLAYTIVQNMMDRADDFRVRGVKRAGADVKAAAVILKQYDSRGGTV